MLAAVLGSAGVAAPAPAADQGAVTIGVLGDQSSAYSSVGGRFLLEEVKMAVEDFGGTMFGKPIEVVSGDTQLKPDVASSLARQWFDEGVDMITDIPSTNIAFAVGPLAEQRNKIMMVTSAASSDITGPKCSPNVAHWTYDTYSVARSSAATLMDRGAKTWFILNQDSATGIAAERDIAQVVQEKGGRMLGSVKAPVTASDFSSFIIEAQAANADVYAIAPAGSAGVTAIKQASEFGLMRGKARLVSIFIMPDDVKALGLERRRAWSMRRPSTRT